MILADRKKALLGLLAVASIAIASLEYDAYFNGGYFDATYFQTAYFEEGSAPSSFDQTGLPIGWDQFTDVLKTPEFVAIKQQECDGDAVWAKWRAGTATSPRGSANCVVQLSLVRQEADGSAVWARWSPGVTNHGSANLQIDIRAALTADFVVN